MVFVLIFLALFFPLFTQAKEHTVPAAVINEVAWMGTPVEGVDSRQYWRYEWVELRSTTERSVVLDRWNVELYKDEELYFTTPLAGTIPAKGYFLVAAHDKIPGVDVNYGNLGGKFVNTGMRVLLKDHAGTIGDEVDAREGWPAGDNESKRTMERVPLTKLSSSEELNLVKDAWQTSADPGGTPRGENSAGFTEPDINQLLRATKKDPQGPSGSFDAFTAAPLLAALLALGSSVGILGLRKFLARQS